MVPKVTNGDLPYFSVAYGRVASGSTEIGCKDVHTQHKGLRLGNNYAASRLNLPLIGGGQRRPWSPVQVWSLHSLGRHKQALHIGQHKVNQDGHINEHPDHVPRGRVPQKTNQAEQPPDYDQDQSQGSGPVLQLP